MKRGKHIAQFEVNGEILTVTSEFGVKKTQLGDSEPQVLAGIILGEQIVASKISI